jgi:hypothetical protein
MKNLNQGKTLVKLAGMVLMSSAIALPVLTDRASAVDPAIVNEAQQLCIEDAKAKGFELKEVVTAAAADKPGKDAKIVLHLLKAGQDYKQTCYYDKTAKSVSFFDDIVAGTTTPDKTYTPVLWWLLLPIIGLPLLLWATRNRHTESDRTAASAVRNHGTRYYDALIRTVDGSPIQVYEEPSYTAKVLGTVQDGQTVHLTGRENEDWCELVGGGWLPKQYVRTSANI